MARINSAPQELDALYSILKICVFLLVENLETDLGCVPKKYLYGAYKQ